MNNRLEYNTNNNNNNDNLCHLCYLCTWTKVPLPDSPELLKMLQYSFTCSRTELMVILLCYKATEKIVPKARKKECWGWGGKVSHKTSLVMLIANLNDREKTSEFRKSSICPVLQEAWIAPGLPWFYSITIEWEILLYLLWQSKIKANATHLWLLSM